MANANKLPTPPAASAQRLGVCMAALNDALGRLSQAGLTATEAAKALATVLCQRRPAATGLSYRPCYDEVAKEYFVVVRAGSGHEGDYLAVHKADSAAALWALIADKACG